MDTDELDEFLFQELHQTAIESEATKSDDITSSWLNLDNVCTPAPIPIELQELEHHLLSDTVPSLTDHPYNSFFREFNNPNTPVHIDDSISMAVGHSTVQEHFPNEYAEYAAFFNDPGPCFIAPPSSIQDRIVTHDSSSMSLYMNNLPPFVSQVNNIDIQQSENQVVEDENNEEKDDEPKTSGTMNCKNLTSERNRRKRLSQQLLALRSLVPNITKMDKRSVLVDALSYLRSIHEETTRILKELKEQPPSQPRLMTNFRKSCQDNPAGILQISDTFAPASSSRQYPCTQIIEVDTEKIEEQRFIVKLTCKSGIGVFGDVIRIMETMGVEITCVSLQQMLPNEIRSTILIRARKQGRMTEEKLKDNIISTALRSGLTFQNP